MENTCDPDKCPLAQTFGQDKCPNYIETWWQEEGMDKPKLFKDCAPKRTLIMMQELHNRMIGVQKQQAEVCGEVTNFIKLHLVLKELQHVEDEKLIEHDK